MKRLLALLACGVFAAPVLSSNCVTGAAQVRAVNNVVHQQAVVQQTAVQYSAAAVATPVYAATPTTNVYATQYAPVALLVPSFVASYNYNATTTPPAAAPQAPQAAAAPAAADLDKLKKEILSELREDLRAEFRNLVAELTGGGQRPKLAAPKD